MKLKYIIITLIGLMLLLFVLLSFNTKNDSAVKEQVQTETFPEETQTQTQTRNTEILETENYYIEIIGCEEGNVTCNDVSYYGVNKNTQESVTIQNGKTLASLCADGVTPCRFIGYEFINDDYTYLVYEEGKLEVKDSNGKIILEEEGNWKR